MLAVVTDSAENLALEVDREVAGDLNPDPRVVPLVPHVDQGHPLLEDASIRLIYCCLNIFFVICSIGFFFVVFMW